MDGPQAATVPSAHDAAADITLTGDQYQALQAASARFRPITGPAALLRQARTRFGS